MRAYPAVRQFDPNIFCEGIPIKKTFYGLPEDVRFCQKCVISNQRPNSAIEFLHKSDTLKTTINFDETGICDACRLAEKKIVGIDWSEREKQLRDVCDQFRRSDGFFDCLVPGSGGKDSFYAAHILKTKYNMHPLTITWAPHIYTEWGWQNFQSWIHAGFDNLLFTPNGLVHRLLTRLAIENLFHPFQPFMLGQKLLPPKIAILHNIKLIFYGENEAEYGNPLKDSFKSKRDITFFSAPDPNNTFLSGVSVSDLKRFFGIQPNDLISYLPLDSDQLRDHQIETHYLGYYLKWHPQSCYYYSVEHGGFQASPERTPGTYSKYNSIDDKMDDLHYYTTYIKFGIGRATYDAAQEIRSGDITREEGVALVKRFDGEFPMRFEKELFQYLSIEEKDYPVASRMFERKTMDRDYFMDLANSFRSPHLWKFQNGNWALRHAVWH